MSEVFISYSSRDRQFADRIAEDLTHLGVKVFYDKELVPGEAWAPRLAHELKRAKYVLVLLSPSYVKSQWAIKELEAAALAESEGSTRIIPVLVEETEIPPFLQTKYYADLRENYQAGMELVRKALTSQPEPSEESRALGLRRAIDLLGVMVSLIGGAVSVIASAVVALTVAALTALVGIMLVGHGPLSFSPSSWSAYRFYRRSPPVELVAHAVQRAYVEALDGSALNPLRGREAKRD